MRECNVRDQPAPEERADAAFRAVVELIRDQDIERTVFLLETPDGARRENPLDAECFEPVDVRAKIELRRQDSVARSVAREKRDALASKPADDVRARWFAERRADRVLFPVGQLRHVVQAAAP